MMQAVVLIDWFEYRNRNRVIKIKFFRSINMINRCTKKNQCMHENCKKGKDQVRYILHKLRYVLEDDLISEVQEGGSKEGGIKN